MGKLFLILIMLPTYANANFACANLFDSLEGELNLALSLNRFSEFMGEKINVDQVSYFNTSEINNNKKRMLLITEELVPRPLDAVKDLKYKVAIASETGLVFLAFQKTNKSNEALRPLAYKIAFKDHMNLFAQDKFFKFLQESFLDDLSIYHSHTQGQVEVYFHSYRAYKEFTESFEDNHIFTVVAW